MNHWSANLEGTGLLERDLWFIRHCALRYPEVEKVILFGSRARGAFRTDSDVDLGVLGTGITHSIANFIKWDLEEVYPFLYSVDVVHLDDPKTSKALVEKALRQGRLLFDRSIHVPPLPPEPRQVAGSPRRADRLFKMAR